MRTSNRAINYWNGMLQSAFAAVILMTALAVNADELTGPGTSVVIQISSGDEQTQNLVLNNAANLQKELGMDNVQIEIVAYGPGLKMVTTSSQFRDRVESLASQHLRFSACENTMAAIERKTGKKPVLANGVGTTPSGVARIVALEQKGYAYVRP